MKVLVTGGGGFIGSHLVDKLMAEGTDVVVLDNLFRGKKANLSDHFSSERFTFIQGDIRDFHTCKDAVKGCDYVYHLAAQSNVMGAVKDLDYSFNTNVVGTYNVLKAAKDANIRRFIFSSSRESYGEALKMPVREDHPLNAKNSYGASKVAGEKYCQVFASMYGMETAIFRFANVYGPRDFDRVIPIFIQSARSGEDINIFGGEQLIDFISIEVIVSALLDARANTGILNGPVNVGSGKGTSLFELAREIKQLASTECQVNILPARSVEVVKFVASMERFKNTFKIPVPGDPLYFLARML